MGHVRKETGVEAEMGTVLDEFALQRNVQHLVRRLESLSSNRDGRTFCFFGIYGQQGVTALLKGVYGALVDLEIGEVLFLEANGHNPSFRSVFGLKSAVGFSELVSGKCSPQDIECSKNNSSVRIAPFGNKSGNASRLFGRSEIERVLGDLRKAFKFVMIDGPPLYAGGELPVLAQACDFCYPVMASGALHEKAAAKAVQILRDSECTIDGVILTRIPQVIPKWLY